jgi:hypothetical protein
MNDIFAIPFGASFSIGSGGISFFFPLTLCTLFVGALYPCPTVGTGGTGGAGPEPMLLVAVRFAAASAYAPPSLVPPVLAPNLGSAP